MDVIKRISQNKGMKGVCAFLETSFFPVLVGAAVLVCYVMDLSVVALAMLALLAAFVCFFCEDTLPALPLLLFVIFAWQYKDDASQYLTKNAFITYGVCGTILFIAALYRICARRVQWKRKSGLLSMALLTAAILLGGVFTEFYTLSNFSYALGAGGALFGLYVFFAFTVKRRKNILVYLARVLVVAIFIIAFELLEYYVQNYEAGILLDEAWKRDLHLGWGISNMVGEMVAFMIPAVFYLIYKEKLGHFYWLVLPVAVVAVFLTLSRNALLWTGIITVLGIFVNCLSGEKKTFNQFFVLFAAVVLGTLFVRLYVTDRLDEFLAFFENTKLDDRGRFDIWKDFAKLFLKSPLHGVGFRAYLGRPSNYTNVIYAHNLFAQIWGSTGTFGMCLFVAHLILVFGILCKKPKEGSLFMVGCVLALWGISMLSPLFFLAYALLYYSALVLCLEKSYE